MSETRPASIVVTKMTIQAPLTERVAFMLHVGMDTGESAEAMADAAIAIVLNEAEGAAHEQRCERGTPWDRACVACADAIRALLPEPPS